MGAYLYYKLEDESNASFANQLLDDMEPQKTLNELGEFQRGIHFYEEDIYPGEGAGNFKTTGITPEYKDELLEACVQVFEHLHENPEIDVKILTRSCSLRISTFSFDQMMRLTNNGKALSGEKKHNYRDILTKRGRIDAFPTNFVTAFSTPDETVLEEPTNTDLFSLDSANKRHRLKDLLRDKRRLQLLDILLTYYKMYVPIDLIVDKTPLTKEEAEKARWELEQYDLIEYKAINTDHHLFDELLRLHNETWQPTKHNPKTV